MLGSLASINQLETESNNNEYKYSPGSVPAYFRMMYFLRLLRKINIVDANLSNATQFGLYNNSVWVEKADLTRQFLSRHKRLIDTWISERYLSYIHRSFYDLNMLLSELSCGGRFTLLPMDEASFNMVANELNLIATVFDDHGYCVSHLPTDPKLIQSVETLDVLLAGMQHKSAMAPPQSYSTTHTWTKIKKDTLNRNAGGPILKICGHLCSMVVQHDYMPVDGAYFHEDRAIAARLIKIYGSFLGMLAKLLVLTDETSSRSRYKSLDESFDTIYGETDYSYHRSIIPWMSMLNEYVHHTDMTPDVAIMLVDAPIIYSDMYRPSSNVTRTNIDEDIMRFLIVECICRQDEVCNFMHKTRRASRLAKNEPVGTIGEEIGG